MLNGFTSSTVLRHQRFYVINGFTSSTVFMLNSFMLSIV